MNRSLAIAMAVACTCATAFADDITIDPNPFVSTASRAQVLEELHQFRQSGVNPWADDYNPVVHARSTLTRAEVTAAYLGSRDEVAALSGEDSGSSYLTRVAAAGRTGAPTIQVAGTN